MNIRVLFVAVFVLASCGHSANVPDTVPQLSDSQLKANLKLLGVTNQEHVECIKNSTTGNLDTTGTGQLARALVNCAPQEVHKRIVYAVKTNVQKVNNATADCLADRSIALIPTMSDDEISKTFTGVQSSTGNTNLKSEAMKAVLPRLNLLASECNLTSKQRTDFVEVVHRFL